MSTLPVETPVSRSFLMMLLINQVIFIISQRGLASNVLAKIGLTLRERIPSIPACALKLEKEGSAQLMFAANGEVRVPASSSCV